MTRRGWVLFAAMCVIWGLPYLFIRVAVRELSPATVACGRTGLAALLLLPLAAARGELRGLLPHWRPIVAFTAIEMAVPWLLLTSAERRITSSLAALLIAAVPLVSSAIVTFTGDDDRLDSRRLAGLLLGLGGVVAIVGLDLGATSGVGLVEVGGVVVGYSLGPIILARWLSDLPPVGVIAASLALCALAYLPLVATQLPGSLPSSHVLASVAALSLLCTALAFILYFALIGEIGPVRATVITYVNPAVAAVVGVAVLGERFTGGMALGFALVLLGSRLATRRAPAPARAPV